MTSVGCAFDSNHNEASILLTLTDLLCLRIDQMSRCRDVAILVVTTDRRTNGLLKPCSCVQVINRGGMGWEK